VPANDVARRIIAASGGGLPVTSANRSGMPESTTAQQVLEQLDGRVAIILDGGTTPVGKGSTIVDCTTEPLTVLREGAISKAQLEEALLGVESYS
jgi:L-threonylcarbamoyladenylate synthase